MLESDAENGERGIGFAFSGVRVVGRKHRLERMVFRMSARITLLNSQPSLSNENLQVAFKPINSAPKITMQVDTASTLASIQARQSQANSRGAMAQKMLSRVLAPGLQSSNGYSFGK